MEVCEDMSVDLQINLRKRQYMEDLLEHPNKRTCNGLVSITNGNGILHHQLNECSLVYWEMPALPQKNPLPEHIPKTEVQMDSMNYSSAPCPRCMAGESGHINHILGL
ncbi:uncharacterized protein C10orf143 homolog [Discoglossus pictus]